MSDDDALVLALDVGSSSVRAVAFDRRARVRGVAQRPLPPVAHAPGAAEWDADTMVRLESGGG